MHADRRPPQRRPLGRRVPGRRRRPGAVDGPGVGRRLRRLARRDRAQARRRPDRHERRDVGGRRHPQRRRRAARPATTARRSRPPSRRSRTASRSPWRSTPSSRRSSSASRRAPRSPSCRSRYEIYVDRVLGPLRLLVRAVPALVRRLPRRARSSSRACRSSASTSSTCRRSTRSATRTARAATTRSSPAPTTRAARGRSATRPAATTRSTRTSARSTTSTRSSQAAARARHRHRARLRDQRLRRPPVAQGAPGVVQPPPRRHDQVRGEPAQEVPGHLQPQLEHATTGRASGTRCWRSSATGSTTASACSASTTRTRSRCRSGSGSSPRSTPPHPDVIFLAEAFTRRAMMRALAKLGFTQSYTYFTWKNSRWELDGVRRRARPHRGGRVLPAELLRQHARHPHRLPRRGRPAGVRPAAHPRRDAQPDATASTRASRTSSTCSGPGAEEYIDNEKFEIKQRRLDGPLLPLVAAPQPDPPRQPGAAAAREPPVPRDRRTTRSSPTPSARAATS